MTDTEDAVDSSLSGRVQDETKKKDTVQPGERSMDYSMEAMSMEETKRWPLGDREVAQLMKLKQMYKLNKVSFMPADRSDLFEAEKYKFWTVTGSYYRAVRPVSTKDFEMASVDLSVSGFLLPFVDSCLILLRDFKLSHLKNYRHHPCALVVNEFHHFAMYLSTVNAPDPSTLKKINQRINLIQAFITETDTLNGMKFYSEWMTLMKDIRKVLEGVHAKWPLFLAQQTIQVTLDRMAVELAMVVKKLLIYQMYVLHGGKKDFKFDPSQPLQQDISDDNLAEGLIYMVLMNEHVYEALNVPVADGLQNARAIFTRLKLPLPDPNAIQTEPNAEVKLYIDQQYQTGLASKSVLHEGSVSNTEFDSAISAWLNLLPKVVGVAGCVRLIRHSHRISGLGGEFLMAKQMSKQFAADIFTFVDNCLRSVLHDVKDLHNVLTDVVGQGKASRAQRILGSSALREGEFELWSKNFSFAQSSYKDVTHWIHNLLPKLADLKERVNTLEVEAVERKIKNEGTTLLNTAGNLFCQFDQWHDSKIPVSTSCIPSIDDNASATDMLSIADDKGMPTIAESLVSSSINTSGRFSVLSTSRQSAVQDAENQNQAAESTNEGGEDQRWGLRKQVRPAPVPTDSTPSMEFRKAMAAEKYAASPSNVSETKKSQDNNSTVQAAKQSAPNVREAKTWTMEYQEALKEAQSSRISGEERADDTQRQSELRVGEELTSSNGSDPSQVRASSSGAPAVATDKTRSDGNVLNLQVSIEDRRTQGNSQASMSVTSTFGERDGKRGTPKCPHCTNTLERVQPGGVVALLHARAQCDECGGTITRRMPRHICGNCATTNRLTMCLEGSRSQASGYTMCTACAVIPRAR